MRIVIRQHYCLPTRITAPLANNPISWDEMRTASEDTPFSIPADPAEWAAKAESNKEVSVRARAIIDLVRRNEIRAIQSHGVGGAWLEYHMKNLAPDLHLTVTDFAPGTVERLSRVFRDCDSVLRLNLIDDTLAASSEHTLCLLHRVDTEFSPRQWTKIFRRQGATSVLFIPSEILTVRSAINHKRRWLKDILRRRSPTFSGYLYSADALQSLWAEHYRLVSIEQVADLAGFLLARKR